MNEGTKTGLFWALAALLVGLAVFVNWPTATDEQALVAINKPLFEEFKDPLAAANLRIVSFDETLGQLEAFEVAKDRSTGLWTIPSRQGYPADAASQMEKAATAFLGLRILDVKTDKAEEHAAFGVIEPNLEKLSVGDAGVGRLVTIKDGDGKNLATLIIGKTVKDIPSHRYVRKPGQDPVYEVELDDSPLTTQFRQWIEEDLLKLDTFDIAGTKIRNYSVAVNATLQGLAVDPRKSYDANLSLDDTNQWKLDSLVVYDDAQGGEIRSLTEDEQVNATKLNRLKTALDDLKIVDVVRKPEGMSADLKADKSLVSNNESIRSLAGRGFYPVQGTGEEGIDILAANGELIVDLKDGVEYILRFGRIAGLDESSSESADEAKEGTEDAAAAEEGAEEKPRETAGGSNRYLLVTTRLNSSMIPPPDLKLVPQTIEELAEMLKPPADPAAPPEGEIQFNPAALEGASPAPAPSDPGSETGSQSGSESSEPVTDQPAPDQPAAEAPAQAGDDGQGEAPQGETPLAFNGQGSVIGQGLPQDGTPPADNPGSGESPAEQPPADQPAPTAPTEESAAERFAKMTEDEKKEYLQAEQEKINKENEKLRDAWKEKMDGAEKRVRDLNARFADWYYVIPESTYADLQVKLEDLIQPKGAAPATPAGPNPAGFPSFNPLGQ